MKFGFLVLPASLEIALVIALHAQTAPVPVLTPAQRNAEITELRAELKTIAARLDVLEAEGSVFLPRGMNEGHDASSNATSTLAQPAAAAPIAEKPADSSGVADGFLRSTTFAFGLDGYYGYNFNAPLGRVNQLRAYDVTSNSFNINQASFIIEHLPTPGARTGGRIDLQFGQATEALQGSSVNEQRPQVWRNLFQAYGSYLAPVGSGLELDFGKFASSFGNEGNYTKDQIAYSRAFSFEFLPFYHMGLRANYNITPKINAAYWLVNGANDTEDLNGFKSQAFLFTLKPASSLTWNVNYYVGQEARDVEPVMGGGLPTTTISPAPNGREHIFDTYATWNATSKLTVVPEADFVVNRINAEQRPIRVAIGSVSAKYGMPHNWNAGARFEYLDDRGGLFSGATQALKEGTVVLDHLFAPSFLARAEYRRDFSNQKFFLTDTTDILVNAQTTATLGLIYWWGTKQGSW